jgi:hypothetical protein
VLDAGTTMGRLLREKRFHEAADHMLGYDHAGGVVLEGLQRRRQQERALFLKPEGSPLSVLTHEEQVAVHEFDRWSKERWIHPVHYANARAQIVRLRQAIWIAAERGILQTKPPRKVQKGWNIEHRAERYNILRGRVH